MSPWSTYNRHPNSTPGNTENTTDASFRDFHVPPPGMKSTNLQRHHSLKGQVLITARRGLRAVLYLFNLHTCTLILASCISVFICAKFKWTINMDFSMISAGTVFPLTFILGQAFTRRERAANLIAELKATVICLYYMHRDWDQSQGQYPHALGNDMQPTATAAKKLLLQFLLSLRRYLTSERQFESVAEVRLTADKKEFIRLFGNELRLSARTGSFRNAVVSLCQSDPGAAHLSDCYKYLSQLSVLNEQLSVAAGYSKGGEGGMSRTSQFLRFMVASVEDLRVIKDYRTPTMMRHACGVLVHIFAVLLAPYFVHFCSKVEVTCADGYISAICFSLIVMLLFHVMSDLENCLLETGLDDTFFTIAEEVDNLAGPKLLRTECNSQGILTHGSMCVASDFHNYLVNVRGSHQPQGGSPSYEYVQSFSMAPLPMRASMGFGHHHSIHSEVLSPSGNSGHSVAPSLERIPSGIAVNAATSTMTTCHPVSSVSTARQPQGGPGVVIGGHKPSTFEVSPFLTSGVSCVRIARRASQPSFPTQSNIGSPVNCASCVNGYACCCHRHDATVWVPHVPTDQVCSKGAAAGSRSAAEQLNASERERGAPEQQV